MRRRDKPIGGDGAATVFRPAALTTFLDAAKARGDVRADVDARDVALLIGYLVRLDAREWGVRAPRLLQVIVDGLRR